MIQVHGKYFKKRVIPAYKPILIPNYGLPPIGYRSMGAFLNQRARDITILNDMSGHRT